MCAIELRWKHRGDVKKLNTFSCGEPEYFSIDNFDKKTVRMFRITVGSDDTTAFIETADNVPLSITADPTRAGEIVYEYQGVVSQGRPFPIPFIQGVEDSPSLCVEYSSPDKVPKNVV